MGEGNEKKILVIILVVAVVLMSFNFLYKPKQKENDTLKSSITELDLRYEDLKSKENQRKQMNEDIIKLENDLVAYNNMFPTDFTQEEIVMLVNYINKATNIKISNVSLSPFEVFNQEQQVEGVVESEIAYVSTVAISYIGNYKSVKSFFQYLKEYPKQVSLASISMSYNQEKGEIAGELSLNLFVLQSADRDSVIVPEYPGLIGKDSIISSNISAEVDYDALVPEKSIVDVYLSLTSVYADMAPVIIGVKSDKSGGSEVKTTNNATSKVTIEFNLKNGAYYVDYEINGVEKKTSMIQVDDSIDIDVYSEVRAKTGDDVKVLATIINNTDKPAKVYVYNDDANSPRFTLEASDGAVTIVE